MTFQKTSYQCVAFLSILLCSITAVSAQKKSLKSGYYVRPGGDTLFGYFVHKNWKHNPREIDFYKTTSLKQHATFYPNTGTAFSIKIDNGIRETYVAYAINGYGDTDSVFLKQIVKGRISIYKWKDEQSSERFYIKKDEGKIEELTEDNAFSMQLEGYMKDCPFVPEVIDIGYNEKDLIELTKIYNRCKGTKLKKKRHESVKAEVALMGGFGNTELSMLRDGVRVKMPESDIRPIFGSVLNLVMPYTKKRLSVQESMYVQSFVASGARELADSQPNNKHIITETFDFTYIKIGSSIQYQLKDRMMMPYIRSGVSYGISIGPDSKSETRYQNGGTTFTESPLKIVDRHRELGWISAMGIQYDHFQIEGRIELGNGISKSPALKTRTKTMTIGVNYVF